jgi:hypothetical protein
MPDSIETAGDGLGEVGDEGVVWGDKDVMRGGRRGSGEYVEGLAWGGVGGELGDGNGAERWGQRGDGEEAGNSGSGAGVRIGQEPSRSRI